MSGWQRIGVVISILWLVGLPIFLMIDTNRRANDFYSDCLGFAYRGITGNTPKQQTDAQIADAGTLISVRSLRPPSRCASDLG